MSHAREMSVAAALVVFATTVALPGRATADEPAQVAAEPEGAARPAKVLQVAGPPPAPEPPPYEPPLHERDSDGAGLRVTFGRTFTQRLNPGFYGRFETEYFEVKRAAIVGVLLGVEGWGTEGATAGGGTIPISFFFGARGGPFNGRKAPQLFFTLGLGVDLVVFDRVGTSNGFGLFSPFGVATAGVEVAPGVRLLADSRAVYRWHWTSRSEGQIQLGLTLGLNSYLWDRP